MLEAVRGLAGDRRARLAQEELALEQVVEQRLVVVDVGREVLERAAPEHPADDRAALQQRLRRGIEVVDASGDERLQRVRHAVGRSVARAALDEHANRLLDEQRVALGAVERLLRQRRRPLARGSGELAQQLLDELRALLLGERLELDRRRAHAPSTPPGRASSSSGRARQRMSSGARTQSARCSMRSSERLLGPVDVLEQEDERLHVGDPLHHLARGPRDLLRAALAFERLHQPGGEAEHIGDGLLGAALAELLERLLERVVVGDPGRRLDHLAERPVRDALAVREARDR